MSELNPCPFPPGEIANIIEKLIPEVEDYMVMYAYQRSALHGAVAALRRAQPANAPLTLEELRGMDGEPVWCTRMQEWRIVWVDHEGECIRLHSIRNTISAEHVWRNDGGAYRRKPEGGAE